MVSTYDELIQQQAQAAVRVMDAHHSSWNHQTGLLAAGDSSRGKVRWDHSINYHASVLDDLRKMFATAGQEHDAETLEFYREAMRVVFHENGSGRFGCGYGGGQVGLVGMEVGRGVCC